MGNTRKPKKRWLAGKLPPKPGADTRIQVAQAALARVDAPEDDLVAVIKEVPAVVTHPQTEEKVTVGIAFIHDDGSVAIRLDEDAPQWAKDLINVTAQEVGYSLETGGFHGPA